jgi:uncharacterized membrane protein YciS (DUF1049 family)
MNFHMIDPIVSVAYYLFRAVVFELAVVFIIVLFVDTAVVHQVVISLNFTVSQPVHHLEKLLAVIFKQIFCDRQDVAYMPLG